MNLNLEFTPGTRVETPTGSYLMKEALATPKFWAAYRMSQFKALEAHGVTLLNKQGRWVVQVNERLSGDLQRPLKGVYELTKPYGLRDWQKPHAGHLVAVLDRHGAYIDASATGTGKTYVTAAVARERKLLPLVVAPKTILRKWAEVCKVMGSSFRCIVGWEEAKGAKFHLAGKMWRFEPEQVLNPKTGKYEIKQKKILESIKWRLPKETLLVFDEAHRAKGCITQNARLLAGSQGIPTAILSATLADSPRDMWAAGGRLGLHRQNDFKEFCEKLLCFKDGTKGWSMVDRDLSARMLHEMLFPERGGRIRIADLGDQFPKNHVSAELVDIETAKELNAEHEAMLRRVEELHELGKNAEVLVERLRYRQAAELGKVSALVEMAEDAHDEGMAVVLFVCFRESMDAIKRKLGSACALIHGDQKQHRDILKDEREQERLRFQRNECPYICVMMQAGGVGLDLHDLGGVQRMSLIAPCDNATLVKQALGRINRDGALSPAIQKFVCAAGTVEEAVYENFSAKILSIDTINDGDLCEPQLAALGPAIKESAE